MVILPIIMQPNTWDDLISENNDQQILIDGQPVQLSSGFANQQLIMLQPPSSAAKVIGILLIIWGSLNAIFLLLAMLG